MTGRLMTTVNRLVVKVGSQVVLSEGFDALVDELSQSP